MSISNYFQSNLLMPAYTNSNQEFLKKLRSSMYTKANYYSGGGDRDFFSILANHFGGRLISPFVYIISQLMFTIELIASIADPLFRSFFYFSEGKILEGVKHIIYSLISLINLPLYLIGTIYLFVNFVESILYNPNECFSRIEEITQFNKENSTLEIIQNVNNEYSDLQTNDSGLYIETGNQPLNHFTDTTDRYDLNSFATATMAYDDW